MWDDYQFELRQKPGCLPAVHPSDFGLNEDHIASLKSNNLLKYITEVANGKQFPKDKEKYLSAIQEDIFSGISHWRAGCSMLASNKPLAALNRFEASKQKIGNAPIVELSRALAYAGLRKPDEANNIIINLYFDGVEDERISVAHAVVGMSNADLGKAQQWLQEPAENTVETFGDKALDSAIKRIWSGELEKELINIIKKYMPDDWQQFYQQAFIAEQYFYTLLWQEKK